MYPMLLAGQTLALKHGSPPAPAVCLVGARVSMRIYFDLRNQQGHILPDLEGVEVDDLDWAQRVALEMIQKLREDKTSVAQDWSGWTLNIVDDGGVVVVSIDLDRSVQ